ncbi:MAG: hypothetical protein KTR29_11125 [Rhodothermaceae bacterium]|nr:hypothetical protein [Rhodothermaceae bacterium]
MRVHIFITFLAASMLSACQSKVIDNSTIVEVEMVSFADDVLPIFVSTCGGTGCHINEAVNQVELTNYQRTISSFAETYNKALVIPGDVAGSPLIDKILANPQFGIRMPDGGPPLSNTQIETISTWVEEGALNN